MTWKTSPICTIKWKNLVGNQSICIIRSSQDETHTHTYKPTENQSCKCVYSCEHVERRPKRCTPSYFPPSCRELNTLLNVWHSESPVHTGPIVSLPPIPPLWLPSFHSLDLIPIILPYQRQPFQTVECIFCSYVWWSENRYTTSLIPLSSKDEVWLPPRMS